MWFMGFWFTLRPGGPSSPGDPGSPGSPADTLKQNLFTLKLYIYVCVLCGCFTFQKQYTFAGSRREALHSWQRSWGRRLGIRKGGIEPQESRWIFSIPIECFFFSNGSYFPASFMIYIFWLDTDIVNFTILCVTYFCFPVNIWMLCSRIKLPGNNSIISCFIFS